MSYLILAPSYDLFAINLACVMLGRVRGLCTGTTPTLESGPYILTDR